MVKYVINIDNSYGGAFTNLAYGINFTELEPNNSTDIWNGSEWVDNTTLEQKIQKAIEIDLYYTKKISDLMMKHNDKLLESFYNDTVYVIPQSALNDKQLLKDECNAKILELGITDFTYRQSVPKLAKF